MEIEIDEVCLDSETIQDWSKSFYDADDLRMW